MSFKLTTGGLAKVAHMRSFESKVRPGLFFYEDGSALISSKRPGDWGARRVFPIKGQFLSEAIRLFQGGIPIKEIPYQTKITPRQAKVFLDKDIIAEYHAVMRDFLPKNQEGEDGQ